MADVDSELHFMQTVSEVTGSVATAKAALAYIWGRCEEPLSKHAMEGWTG